MTGGKRFNSPSKPTHASFSVFMKSSAFLPAFLSIAIFAVTPSGRAADPGKAGAKAAAKPKTEKAAKALELPAVVAVVEGVDIKKSELQAAFDSALASNGGKAASLTNDQKMDGYRSILNDMIIEKLLLKRADKETVSDEEVEATFTKFKQQFPSEDQMNAEIKRNQTTLAKIKENIATSLKEQKWVESQIAGKTDVTDADAQAFYDKNPDAFKQPEMVRASHILIAVPEGAKPEVVAEKEKKAKEIADRVRNGEAFDKVAGEVSDDPGSKAKGGDLNFFSRDRMIPEFSDVAFKLQKDEISAPVKTDFGFHIIKVTDKKDARTVPFEEAKEKILAYLKNDKRRTATEALISEVRATASVKVNLPAPTPKPEVKAEAGSEAKPEASPETAPEAKKDAKE